MWRTLSWTSRRGEWRRRPTPAAGALASLLMLAAYSPSQAQDGPARRFDCQAVLTSPQAGSVDVATASAPPLAVYDPTVLWTPPSTGAPIELAFGFVQAQLGDIGPIQGGHVRFAVPGGVRKEGLGIVFATSDGGRWAFGADRIEFGERDGATNGWFDLGDSDTVPLMRALSSASSVVVSVTADGRERLAARFTFDRAARDALAAKAGAMVEAKDPKVCR